MTDFTYRIQRRGSGVYLTRENRGVNAPIGTYTHVVNHSPDGFEYGYGGSGPAQLALAILCYHTGDENLAVAWYRAFKDEVIAKLDQGKDEHTIEPAAIDAWLETKTESNHDYSEESSE